MQIWNKHDKKLSLVFPDKKMSVNKITDVSIEQILVLNEIKNLKK